MSVSIGAAILFLGSIFFYINTPGYSFQWLFIITAGLGLVPFIFGNFAKEGRNLMNSRAEYYKARAEYYRRKQV